MTKAVLRDVVARMTLDPLFIVQAQADRKRFLRSLDLSPEERSVVVAFLQPRPMGGAIAVHHLPPATALRDSGVLDRVRLRLVTDLTGGRTVHSPGGINLAGTSVGRVGTGGLAGAAGRIHRPGDAVAAGFGAIFGGVKGTGTGLQALGRAIENAGGRIGGDAGNAVAGTGRDLQRVGDGLVKLADAATSGDISGFVEGSIETVGAAVTAFGNALERIGTAFNSPALIAAGKAVSDFGKSISEFAAVAGAVVAAVINTAVDAVASAVSTAASSIADVFTAIGEALGGAIDAIGEGLAGLWNSIVTFFSSLFGVGDTEEENFNDSPLIVDETDDTSPSSPGDPGDDGDDGDDGDGGTEPGSPGGDDPGGGGEAGFEGDNEGTGVGRRPSFGGTRGTGIPGGTGKGRGIGSGVIDPLDTALGRITVGFAHGSGGIGGDPLGISDDDGGGGGPAEPGTGGPARTIGGGKILGQRLRKFVPHFDRDPSPEAERASAAIRSAGSIH
jgi:hypothetical protein